MIYRSKLDVIFHTNLNRWHYTLHYYKHITYLQAHYIFTSTLHYYKRITYLHYIFTIIFLHGIFLWETVYINHESSNKLFQFRNKLINLLKKCIFHSCYIQKSDLNFKSSETIFFPRNLHKIYSGGPLHFLWAPKIPPPPTSYPLSAPLLHIN